MAEGVDRTRWDRLAHRVFELVVRDLERNGETKGVAMFRMTKQLTAEQARFEWAEWWTDKLFREREAKRRAVLIRKQGAKHART